MRHKKLLTILLFSLLSLVLASCSQPSSTANNMAAFVDTYNESC